MIRVDGNVYTWMGIPGPQNLTTQVPYQYTSTQSLFTMDVGGLITMNITFLSPITLNDFQRYSAI